MGSAAELLKMECGVPRYWILDFKLEEVDKIEKGSNSYSLRKLHRRGQWIMKVVIQTVLYKTDK